MLRTILTAALLVASLGATTAHAREPVLRDDFANARSGWPHTNISPRHALGFSQYTGGELQMSSTDDSALGFAPAPRQAEGGDVAVAAKVWLYAGLGGGAAGVACRFQDHRRFYAFLLNGHNGWMIARATPEKLQPLATGKLAGKQIMPGLAEARVEARCNGDQLEMHVNGRKVGSVRDDAYATGISGLMLAAVKAAGANAKFDDFALDRL